MQSFGFGAMKAERYFQAVYRKFSWGIAAIKYRAIFRRSIGSLVGGLLPSRTAGSWAALAMKDLGGGGGGGGSYIRTDSSIEARLSLGISFSMHDLKYPYPKGPST